MEEGKQEDGEEKGERAEEERKQKEEKVEVISANDEGNWKR